MPSGQAPPLSGVGGPAKGIDASEGDDAADADADCEVEVGVEGDVVGAIALAIPASPPAAPDPREHASTHDPRTKTITQPRRTIRSLPYDGANLDLHLVAPLH